MHWRPYDNQTHANFQVLCQTLSACQFLSFCQSVFVCLAVFVFVCQSFSLSVSLCLSDCLSVSVIVCLSLIMIDLMSKSCHIVRKSFCQKVIAKLKQIKTGLNIIEAKISFYIIVKSNVSLNS